jgi:ribonuclease HI
VTLPFDEPSPGRRLVVEADGGSRGNPGPAAYGALVMDADSGAVLDERGEYLGETTNNVAEYSGLIAGLRMAKAIDPRARVAVRMDSKLVVEQMSGRWKIKHEDMRRLALEARAILPRDQVTYQWIPRALNSAADRLANQAMDAAAAGREWQPTRAYPDPDDSAAEDSALPESVILEESDAPMSEFPSTPSSPGVPASPARLSYRLLTGPGDQAFCERVSAALADGYQLHGGPAIAHDGSGVVVAQAVVDPRMLGFGS